MNANGNIEQIGTPKEIYEFPVSRFVANFVGNTNIIEGSLKIKDDIFNVDVEGLGTFDVFCPIKKNWMIPGCQLYMSIRPEKIYITKKSMEGFSNYLEGKVSDIIYYGRSIILPGNQSLPGKTPEQETWKNIENERDDAYYR